MAIAPLPVLLVDDEAPLLRSASAALRTHGIARVIECQDSRNVPALLAEQTVGVVVLDLSMPHVPGQELLRHIASDYPEIPVIVMSGTSELATAVDCMKGGAVDYLVKPAEAARLCAAVGKALENRALRAELLSLKDSLLAPRPARHSAFAGFVTQNRPMQAIFRYLEAIAPSSQPVLITGESGTGKELVARAVHAISGRSGPLVAVNVAGLDDTMFSDTLFGHLRGAYTGAERQRDGLVHSAADGTLFLDEIGDLAISSQVRLLRLLQDGSYYAVGSDQPRQSRTRIVVATNRDVLADVDAGRFRRDLYHRLHTHHVQLPPLRERPEDLPFLVGHFLERAARDMGKPVPTVPPALYQLLRTYAFPGNVRELESMCFDAAARHEAGVLSMRSFRDVIDAGQHATVVTEPGTGPSVPQWLPDTLPTLKEAEDALISEAVRRAQGNQGIAAGILGISRQALNRRLVLQRQAGRESGDQR